MKRDDMGMNDQRRDYLIERAADQDETLGDGAWTKDEQSGEMFWSGSIGRAQVRITNAGTRCSAPGSNRIRLRKYRVAHVPAYVPRASQRGWHGA